MVGDVQFPSIPSIVERVRSGPEQSRARRFLARRSATLDREDRCETITEGRKVPSSNSAYPLQSRNSRLGGQRNPSERMQETEGVLRYRLQRAADSRSELLFRQGVQF